MLRNSLHIKEKHFHFFFSLLRMKRSGKFFIKTYLSKLNTTSCVIRNGKHIENDFFFQFPQSLSSRFPLTILFSTLTVD